MVQGDYKIRVKQGDVEIEIEGDKDFVIQTFKDAKMIWKEQEKKDEETLPDILKEEKRVLRKKPEKPVIPVEKKDVPAPEPVKVEPKKRGRKPGKVAEKAKEPAPPVKAEPKKRGRKPGKAAEKAKEPAPPVKAEPKKRGRKPSKVVKEEKPAKVEKTPRKVDVEKPMKKVKVDLKGKDLGVLLKLKDPKSDADKIVLAGYHINKNERKREFKSGDIEDIMKKFNVETPNNVSYHLRKLSDDKGLLTHGRKSGRYKVSDSGIKWVEYN